MEKSLVLMDTYVTIRVFYQDLNRAAVEQAIADATERMSAIDSLCNRYRENSEINRVNRLAGRQSVALSNDMATVLQRALQVSRLSNGLFDPTVGVLLIRYGFGRSDTLHLMSEAERHSLLPLVHYENIRLRGDSVRFAIDGLTLDLGGIAKGYAVDEAMNMLQARGITDAQIDAGGDLVTISSPLTAGRRHIYIRHPRDREKFFGRFRMDTGTVATSGDYERFFMYNGERFHHLLDPRTGLPARLCRSVTIRASDPTLADGLSTAVFILGPDQGMALVEQLADVEAVIIYEEVNGLQYKVSSGLQASFELL